MNRLIILRDKGRRSLSGWDGLGWGRVCQLCTCAVCAARTPQGLSPCPKSIYTVCEDREDDDKENDNDGNRNIWSNHVDLGSSPDSCEIPRQCDYDDQGLAVFSSIFANSMNSEERKKKKISEGCYSSLPDGGLTVTPVIFMVRWNCEMLGWLPWHYRKDDKASTPRSPPPR